MKRQTSLNEASTVHKPRIESLRHAVFTKAIRLRRRLRHLLFIAQLWVVLGERPRRPLPQAPSPHP
jgi:hypothetical protein